MNIPDTLRYTKDHEWIRVEGDYGVVGITDYAQSELGDIVFVELPQVGSSFSQGQSFGTIEAVKAVSDLFLPASGEIVEVNANLGNAPELINKDPYGEGWMVKIRIKDHAEIDTLLDAKAYRSLIGQ
ncbi:MAG: glycine cleavage system protein GcvH [Bacteroidota bacterium]